MNWRSQRSVVLLLAAVCGCLFIAGMVAFFLNRHDTICSDGKPPVAQRGGILGQVVVRCHSGQVVTLNN